MKEESCVNKLEKTLNRERNEVKSLEAKLENQKDENITVRNEKIEFKLRLDKQEHAIKPVEDEIIKLIEENAKVEKPLSQTCEVF